MKIGVYHLYNYAVGKHGEPFGMCDRHYREYVSAKVPVLEDGTCRLDKIADSGNLECDDCTQNQEQREEVLAARKARA